MVVEMRGGDVMCGESFIKDTVWSRYSYRLVTYACFLTSIWSHAGSMPVLVGLDKSHILGIVVTETR